MKNYQKFIKAQKLDKIKSINALHYNNLIMFNYFKSLSDWSDLIVRQSRGIVFDKVTGNTIIKSFDKFFNYNQNAWMMNEYNENDEEQIKQLSSISSKEKRQIAQQLSSWPNSFKQLRVYDKLDGSIMNVSIYQNELICSSSGSIDGIYPTYFKKAIENHLGDKINEFKHDIKNLTLTFEFINPSLDPHIVKYDKNDLVLLGVHNNVTYEDYEFTNQINLFANKYQFERPKQYNNIQSLNDMQVLLKQLDQKEEIVEGLVVVFELNDNSTFRLKFKTPTYVDLHHQLEAIVFSPYTKANAITIYKQFESDTIDDLLAQYQPNQQNLKAINFYKNIYQSHYNIINEIIDYIELNDLTPNKLNKHDIRKNVMKDIGSKYQSFGIMLINYFYKNHSLSNIKLSENEFFSIWFNNEMHNVSKKLKNEVQK